MTSRVRKQTEGLPQKMGPMKATLAMSSLMRGSNIHNNNNNNSNNNDLNINNISGTGNTGNRNLFATLSSQMRHISPDHTIMYGHGGGGGGGGFRSPRKDMCIRRTASLDTLYVGQSQPLSLPHGYTTILQFDKGTQTEDVYFERSKFGIVDSLRTIGGGEGGSRSCPINSGRNINIGIDKLNDIKIEKVIRQRLQKAQNRGGEHSVSSQTLSPMHVKANPVSIPPRTNSSQIRPMRNSVEGLNQEIEKLVLYTGQQHTCRPEISLFSRGTPDGHRVPLADLLHGDTRSVNTQTPNRDHLSSDESESTSPEDGASSLPGASPRINRFLSCAPNDCAQKVCLKLNEADQTTTTVFKPCVGFQLRPSLGSAFQPLQPVNFSSEKDVDLLVHNLTDDKNNDDDDDGKDNADDDAEKNAQQQ